MKTWKNLGIFAISAVSLGVVACGGSDGAPGAKGDTGAAGAAGAQGPAGDANKAVGVIVPNIGLLDRELDVTITTSGVDLTKAAPTVDLGAGATVSKIQVLSATTLYAHVAVDAAAATGARDVKVTAGSDTLTSTKGFTVAAPLRVSSTSAQQGGLVGFSADNLDTQHAFNDFLDVFSGGYDFFETGLLDGGLSKAQPFPVTATHFDGAVVLVDPLGPTSIQPIAANIDPNTNAPTDTFAGDAIPVAARSATALTIGTPLTGQNIAAALGTNLYKYNTAAIAILEVSTTATGTAIAPDFVLYGPGGKSADYKVFAGTPIVYPVPAASTDAYMTVFDDAYGGGAAAAYGYTVSIVSLTGTANTEGATAHGALGSATALTALPAASTNNGDVIVGSNGAGAEQDWYSLTLAQNDNLEVTVDSAKDVTVDLVDGTQTSIWDNGPLFGGGIETATQTIAAAGSNTYYIVVTSTDGMTTAGGYLISLRKR